MAPVLNFQEDFELIAYNSMGLASQAKYFVSVVTIEELKEALSFAETKNLRKLILGGGSNVLFITDFEGLVINMALKGESIVKEDEAHVYLKVNAGENWHKFVLSCVEKGWGGIENLSLIPGSVGASPIQNIGAYGVELKDVFDSLEALDISTRKIRTFSKGECNFGYRNSIFKNELKNKVVITSVTFKLQKNAEPKVDYKALVDLLEDKGIFSPTIKDVSEAVIEVRKSKLPDPAKIGNTGSFFKNPIISIALFEELKKEYKNMPSYKVSNNFVKVPAGWLIEKAGWKGVREGDAGVHAKQALVLVNYGKASGAQIWDLAMRIKASILKEFKIELTPEVNIIS